MVFVPDSLAGDADYRDWLEQIGARHSAGERQLLEQACRFAHQAYAGVITPCGVPLFQHTLGVADITDRLHLDMEAVIAALLYAVEDEAALCQRFGTNVAHLVDGVQRMGAMGGLLDTAPRGRARNGHIESFRKLLLAMVEDMRAVIIKLAERAQTLRQLGDADADYRRRVALETRELHAPLANRLGIWRLKWELEDLSFRHLEPEQYRQVAALIDERRVDRERYIQQVLETLRQMLAAGGLEHAEVTGRPKHIYSIWRKMRRKKVPFTELYDVRAVRILVDSAPQCYTALGLVHGRWQPVPGEFDDYISHPKDNNYQSLHTAVVGPEGKALEVQIRTREMHGHAELGVAAHWRYKEGGSADERYQAKIAWLRQLLEWRYSLSGEQLVEEFQHGLFQDTVYVLTPQDRVLALPAGATPIDFAYHVHTELGHRCRGAKVDGRIVPLSYRLQQGQKVEILAAREGGPSRDWLAQNMVASHRARAKIRYWLKTRAGEDLVARGREQMEREARRQGRGLPNLERTARVMGFAGQAELLRAVGQGSVGARQVLSRSEADSAVPAAAPAPPVAAARRDAVLVGDTANLTYSMARCCHPMPPDAIVAYVSQGRGVMVHRADCSGIVRLPEARRERLIDARWQEGGSADLECAVRVEAADRPGLLRDLSDILAREQCNVLGVNSSTRSGRARLRFTYVVQGGRSPQKVLDALGRVAGVESVRRG